MSKPYFSPTQIELISKCPEAYRRRYIEGEKIPPGIAMIRGLGFHGGIKVNFRQKIETHQDLPATQMAEIAASEFDKQLKGGYILQGEEQSRGASVVIGEAKDQAVNATMFHATHQAPDYQPVFVEEKITIQLPGPRNLLGVVDMADDQDQVVDFKTAGRAKSQNEADSSVQLTTYSAAFEARTGRIPLNVILDSVVLTKKPYRQALNTSRGARDMEALKNRINSMIGAIESGVFTPTSPGSWWCSEKWCGYWHTCPYVNSERREAANVNGGE